MKQGLSVKVYVLVALLVIGALLLVWNVYLKPEVSVTDATEGLNTGSKTNTDELYPLEEAPQSDGVVLVKYTQEELDEMEYNEITNPTTPYALGFTSGSFTPTQPLGDRLEAKVQEFNTPGYEGKNYTYGFIMITGLITPEKLQPIRDYGVRLFGYHSSHSYASKIPLNKVYEIVNLSYVRWAGYSTLEQKLNPGLIDILNNSNETQLNEEMIIAINIFEDDAPENYTEPTTKEEFEEFLNRKLEVGEQGKILEQHGVKLTDYYKSLKSYHGSASPAVIEQIIKLDFVLHVEKMGGIVLFDEFYGGET